MAYKFSDRSLKRMAGVDQRLQRVAIRAIQISRIDFGIPEYGGIRTLEDQKTLFDQGKSQCDGIHRRSNHQDGNALDFYAYVDGSASWEKEHLAQIAAAFLQAAIELDVKIEWGGLWKDFQDMPHIQIMC